MWALYLAFKHLTIFAVAEWRLYNVFFKVYIIKLAQL